MSKLDIHGCVECVREHFYKADYLHLEYTLPIEAYSLNRKLQYKLCTAWSRFEYAHRENFHTTLTPRECVMLAEAWLIAAPDYTEPMFVNGAWNADCKHCGKKLNWNHIPKDRWVCSDDSGNIYEPQKYKEPSGGHPTDIKVNRNRETK